MQYLFSAALLANTFALTALMILLGLSGQSFLAAEFGIVHGATVAIFGALSANARSMILRTDNPSDPHIIFKTRLLMLLPLAAICVWLSIYLAKVGFWLAVLLVLRRGAEWLAEVVLSDAEIRKDHSAAKRFLAIQVIATSVVAAWLVTRQPHVLWVIGFWALSPLLVLRTTLDKFPGLPATSTSPWSGILPQVGSTAIIGIAVYVFRLLLLLLVGKSTAGDLYTAFAIGGILGSVFAQAIGPTMVLAESRARANRLPRIVVAVLVSSCAAGLLLYWFAPLAPSAMPVSGKSVLFWQATGLSLIGGSIMVLAQLLRLRILQKHHAPDVFGPDVLSNILLVAAIPFVFYLLGREALCTLYLLSAVLSLLFFRATTLRQDNRGNQGAPVPPWAISVMAAGLLLPLFFHINGSIFNTPVYVFDTQGLLSRLPIPLSVAVCFGSLLVIGGYNRANLALGAIFSTFVLMLVSAVLLAHVSPGGEQAKLILMIQFVLPMIGLVLGQCHVHLDGFLQRTSKGFAVVIALIVPAQLAISWSDGMLVLSPVMRLFSVYQHIQYVVAAFVAAYVITLFTLWREPAWRTLLILLAAPMAFYAGASIGLLPMAGLLTGVTAFALWALRTQKHRRLAALIAVLTFACAPAYFLVTAGKVGGKYDLVKLELENPVMGPRNVVERVTYWKFYVNGVLSSPKTAVLGHPAPPDRSKYPSAHNYYLDFAYNFGLGALIPLLVLIAITLSGIWRQRSRIMSTPHLMGLGFAVIYLVLLENAFKVGMRQPYPGIFTFFVWGLLLSQLFPSPESSKDSG